MGYYADLIKQKQEKRNFRDPLFTKVVGVGTPDDYKAKFKKGDKVKLKGSNDEGIIVEGPIKMRASLTPTYRIKLTDGKVVGRYEEELAKNSKDNEKEEKENDAAQTAYDYALKLAQQTGDPNFFKVLHRSREHFLANPGLIREWIDEMKSYMKKAGIKNSEEKDNASVQDRFRHKGCMITILKKGENQYTFTIEQDGREEGTNATYPTQDKAESEAKREVEVNWNEKEEGYYAKLIEEKNSTYDTEKLAQQVKKWLSTGAYSERDIADKLEKDYGMSKAVASHTLELGKKLRAQG